MFRFIVSFILGMTIAAPVIGADDIAGPLKRAEATHAAELARLREQAIDDIKDIILREQKAGVVPNFMLKELKGFEENGVVPILPKLLPASKKYLDGKNTANAVLEAAYNRAIDDYTKAKKLDLALSVKVDLKKLRERMTATPQPKTNEPIGVAGPPAKDTIVEEEYEWQGKKLKRLVRTITLGGVKMEFVRVPPGKFSMGSPDSDREAQADEKPQHTVMFTKELWVAKFPVTFGQFTAFVKLTEYQTEPERNHIGGAGYDGGSNQLIRHAKYTWQNTGWNQTMQHPVVNISWNDTTAYCRWASKEAKREIRLLSEAEHEYANRAGTTTTYSSGDNVEKLKGYANVSDKSYKAKFPHFTGANFDDQSPFASPVGNYKANGFGLYDMTGNVWNWCGDKYDAKIYHRDDLQDPKANEGGDHQLRVLRGGSWSSIPKDSRAAVRINRDASACNFDFGFRICFRLD